jgi:hypothetical protein
MKYVIVVPLNKTDIPLINILILSRNSIGKETFASRDKILEPSFLIHNVTELQLYCGSRFGHSWISFVFFSIRRNIYVNALFGRSLTTC